MINFGSTLALIGGNTKILWYLTRATGIVSMVFLGLIVLLGIATATKVTPKGFGKFLGPELHRRLSLTALIFLAVHIVTAVLDPFVKVGWVASLVPFASAYRPLWIGLGTIAFDLLLVVIATSVIRHRFAHGIWKRIHYLSWAIVSLVLFHAIGTGSDVQLKIVEVIYVAFIGALGLAAIFRARRGSALARPQRTMALFGVFGLPVLLFGWAVMGPLKVGWAKASQGFSPFARVASPGATLAGSGGSGGSGSIQGVPASFSWPLASTISGTISSQVTSSGTTLVTLNGSIANTSDVLKIQLMGHVQGGALVLSSSSGQIGTSADPAIYTGTVAQASGSALFLSIAGPAGTVGAQVTLSISGSTFTGAIQAPAAQPNQAESN